MKCGQAPDFKITCTSADKQGRFTQFYSVELTPKTWEQELAHARTFCFYDEIEYLIKNGLIRGGSLENAVVIRDDAVLTNEPLRYPEEFVRHKILDIIGDLSLLGRPLQGHLIAVKPSHASNCEFVRLVSAQMRKPLVAARDRANQGASQVPAVAVMALRVNGQPVLGAPEAFRLRQSITIWPYLLLVSAFGAVLFFGNRRRRRRSRRI